MEIIKILLLLIIAKPVYAEQVVSLAFDDLGKYLETQNGEVESSRLRYQSAQNRDGYLRRKFTPTLEVETGGEKFSTGPYNLTQPYGRALMNINLFNGKRDSYNNQIINSEIQQKKTEYNQKYLEELFAVRKLYWSYLYEKEIIQILTHALEMNEKNLASAKVRIRTGITTSTDQLEFEQNGLQVSQDLNRAKIELANFEREIKATLNLPEDSTLSSSEIIPHEHADELMKSDHLDTEKHRNNQWFLYQQSIVDSQRKLSRNWWTPSFDLYASAAHLTQKDRDYFTYSERNDLTLGVRISMNLFDGGESYNQSKSFYLQTAALEREAAQVRKELAANFQNSKAILNLTHGQIHFAEENVKKSEQYFHNTISEYSRGIKNSPDVLQASQRLVNSKIRLIELKKDYQVARTSLLYSLGN